MLYSNQQIDFNFDSAAADLTLLYSDVKSYISTLELQTQFGEFYPDSSTETRTDVASPKSFTDGNYGSWTWTCRTWKI